MTETEAILQNVARALVTARCQVRFNPRKLANFKATAAYIDTALRECANQNATCESCYWGVYIGFEGKWRDCRVFDKDVRKETSACPFYRETETNIDALRYPYEFERVNLKET